jgi:arylsulfatase A-like enzyme
VLLLAVWTAARAQSPAPSTTAAALRPNIVFLLVDDLGSYDVGWRGSEIKTPHLDALAKAGTALDQFYVQPVCSPTRAALLTGRYPYRYGFQTGVVRPWAQYGLPLEEQTLARELKGAGYKTAIVGKWHLGHHERAYLPTQRGFDHQYGHYNGALDYYTHERDGGHDWHRNDESSRDEGYATELIGKEAARVVREHDPAKKRPLFLYVPFNGVHSPYQVPAKYEELYPQLEGRRRTYAGMVTAVDEAVGQIVAALREAKLLEQTLIIFSSDNGGPAPGKITSNGPLRAGKGTVYEGGVRVAAFATWPGQIPAGRTIKEPLHMVDWYPTLLKLAGAVRPQTLPLDGRDIWPVLTKGAATPHNHLILNASPEGGAVRAGRWKLVIKAGVGERPKQGGKPKQRPESNSGNNLNNSVLELFDLAVDPGEATNLAEANPDKVKELLALYEAALREAVPPKTGPKPRGFQSPAVWGETGRQRKLDG